MAEISPGFQSGVAINTILRPVGPLEEHSGNIVLWQPYWGAIVLSRHPGLKSGVNSDGLHSIDQSPVQQIESIHSELF